jgi:sugar/nucleoside kinase (ribokinase family)
VGDRYGLTRDVWLDPEQAGLDAQDVVITTPDGRQFPAWEIPVEGSAKWAILTHGTGASRSEMLRMARPLNKADYNVLIINYTGDVGAPPYDDGVYHFGRTEWQEVQAAVEYADAAGAETIVLGGASHGGAVMLGFLARGELARRVDGLILDAPASSFEDVIDEGAELISLPVGDLPIPESLEDAVTRGDAGPVVSAARRLIDRGVGAVLATLGAAGAVLVNADGGWLATPPPITPRSTVGAGDSSLAGYVRADVLGCDAPGRLQMAVAYGSGAAALPGSALPTPAQVNLDDVAVTSVSNPSHPTEAQPEGAL